MIRLVGMDGSLFIEDDQFMGLAPCERVVDKIKSSCQSISAACMCSGFASGIVHMLQPLINSLDFSLEVEN